MQNKTLYTHNDEITAIHIFPLFDMISIRFDFYSGKSVMRYWKASQWEQFKQWDVIPRGTPVYNHGIKNPLYRSYPILRK